MKKILLFVFAATIITACQNKKQQMEAQQKHDDSIKQSTVVEMQKQQAAIDEGKKLEAEKRIEAEKLAAQKKDDKKTLEEMIVRLNSDLAGENQRMSSIKSFQLLRTSDEKAEQVRKQAEVINRLRLKISDTEGELRKLEAGEAYVIPE